MEFLLAVVIFGVALIVIGMVYCRHDLIGPIKEE